LQNLLVKKNCEDHLFEPDFATPMPYPERYDDPDDEELLGVEYAQCQSTDFRPRDYYVEKGVMLGIVIR